MKNVIKLGLLCAALVTSVVVNASTKLDVNIASKVSKVLSISLLEVVEGEVINFKDLNGVVLFSETLEKSADYTKRFNLSDLPAGIYFIETEAANKIQSTPVIISDDTIKLLESSSKTFTAPEITMNEGVVKVLVNNTNKVPVSIVVYDNSGDLLIEKEDNMNELVYSSYDTSELKSTSIIISVTEGDYNFVKEIKL